MPSSELLKQLYRRVRELERHLVPPIDARGNYGDAVYDCMRGFRLLVHAEIEAYIEARCLEIAQKAHQAWSNHNSHSAPICALVAYYKGGFGTIPDSVVPKQLLNGVADDLAGRVLLCFRSYNANARAQNHGIKEENLLSLLLPLGIRASDIDLTWLNTINSFGKTRGTVAHTAKHTQQPIDPKTEVAIVGQVLRGLRSLDSKLGALV